MAITAVINDLVIKIDKEFEAMRERWWDMTADELIQNAERINNFYLITAGRQQKVTTLHKNHDFE